MLLTLLAWTYISLVCLAWGNILLRATGNVDAVKGLGPVFMALFTGLAAIGIIGLYFSLFTNLSLIAHLVICIPAIGFYFFPSNRRLIKEQWNEARGNFSTLYLLPGIAAVIMILAISSHTIIHPDTLIYHAQAILWMEKYPAIPGMAHVDIHLGFQSWWFGVLALFRFSFLAEHPYIFMNGCVVVWFIFFVAERLSITAKRKETHTFSGWILLLAFSLLSWTQVRLTAASASPDFVAALYIWGAIYLFMHAPKEQQNGRYFLSLYFCCAAFGVKLSAIVILLLAAFIVVSTLLKKRYKTFLLLTLVGSIAMAPFIARNVISTGYPLFPSLFADFFRTEWKIEAGEIDKLQHYITAYARLEAESMEAAEAIMQYPLSEWLPGWWNRITWIDKGLLAFILLLALYNLVTIKKQIRNRNLFDLVVLLVSLAGCVTWFVSAPDPRFGTSFLIPMAYILFAGTGHTNAKPGAFRISVIVICLAILLYAGYRFTRFFDARQLIFPKGVMQNEHVEKACQGIRVYVPAQNGDCGMCPVPCLQQPCDSILIIDLKSGFRSR